MSHDASIPLWRSIAVLVGRLVFAGVFIMAAAFKFADINGTAAYIAGAGFSFPLFLAWVAAIFEILLVIGFVTGAFFAEIALLAAAYVLLLAFSFYGPSNWGDQMKMGSFINHFIFIAGLLFAAVHGPGQWAIRRTLIGRYR